MPNWTLLTFELKRHFKRKSYWGATLAVPLVVIVLVILAQVGTAAAEKNAANSTVGVMDFNYVDPGCVIDVKLAEESGGTQVFDVASAIHDVEEGRTQTLLVFPVNPANGRIDIYENNKGLVGDQRSTPLARHLLQISTIRGAALPELAKPLTGSIEVNRVGYRNGSADPGLSSVVPPLLFLLLYFVVTIFLGNQIMSSFAEEREQKIREVLFLDTSPASVYATKILTTAVLGLVQLLSMSLPLVVVYVAVGRDLGLPLPAFQTWVLDGSKMVVGLLILLLGVVFMVSIHAAIGARLRSVREGSAFATLFVILMFAPGYALGLLSEEPGSQIVQLFTFFPPTAPSTLLFRNAFGNVSAAELIVSCAVLLVASSLAFFIGRRVYAGKGARRGVVGSLGSSGGR
ncbi:ABC transporter permease [Paenarthrobacter sp. A20]|uniref:ABC transporter permease n=1 Tax=Paenarthrobacter sp. A20 TaxID=2817891 RepID=UPI00209E1659|nr:ABC transporter permease [Paenarthrobacter sp. A20]MCP1410807.1 ABC-2 type transport system permease protein [Paenarthrobacter sp. A20]